MPEAGKTYETIALPPVPNLPMPYQRPGPVMEYQQYDPLTCLVFLPFILLGSLAKTIAYIVQTLPPPPLPMFPTFSQARPRTTFLDITRDKDGRIINILERIQEG